MKTTMHRRRLLLAGAGLAATAWLPALPAGAQGRAFDHGHADWTALLKRHVRWLPDGKQSRVDYAGFQRDGAALKAVLDRFSALDKAGFEAFPRPQQMAFLINAYNAFTIELILTRYPDLSSIKDLGSLFKSPWKIEFFELLGARRHLDWIEHEQLRPGYQDPRVHAAVNCASIGCPALRDEAFVAERLDAQLEDGMRRFMGDPTRNRVQGGELQVSAIFKWFREDFEQGHLGLHGLPDLFARYAGQLSDQPALQAKLKAKADLPIRFLDYDWSLNVVGR
jgi:hypothetical protein